MKYILIESRVSEGVVEHIPIIFPKTLNHSDVARDIKDLLFEKYNRKVNKVVSAGDCNVNYFQVGGYSETLKIESRGAKDHEIIKMIDYFPIKQ